MDPDGCGRQESIQCYLCAGRLHFFRHAGKAVGNSGLSIGRYLLLA